MHSRFWRTAFLGLALLPSCKGKDKVDERAVVDSFHQSLTPLIAAFDATSKSATCESDRVKQKGGGRIPAYDVDVLRALARGEVAEERLLLRPTPVALRPTSDLGSSGITRQARFAPEALKYDGVVAVYSVESYEPPVVNVPKNERITSFQSGRVSIRAVLMEYPSATPLCPISFSAENSEGLMKVTQVGENAFAGPVADLIKNAEQAFSRELRAVAGSIH